MCGCVRLRTQRRRTQPGARARARRRRAGGRAHPARLAAAEPVDTNTPAPMIMPARAQAGRARRAVRLETAPPARCHTPTHARGGGGGAGKRAPRRAARRTHAQQHDLEPAEGPCQLRPIAPLVRLGALGGADVEGALLEQAPRALEGGEVVAGAGCAAGGGGAAWGGGGGGGGRGAAWGGGGAPQCWHEGRNPRGGAGGAAAWPRRARVAAARAPLHRRWPPASAAQGRAAAAGAAPHQRARACWCRAPPGNEGGAPARRPPRPRAPRPRAHRSRTSPTGPRCSRPLRASRPVTPVG